MKILIFGLPGSGKTTLAQYLMDEYGDDAIWINADAVRKECNDWDFSDEGRERQLQRMRILTEQAVTKGKIAITDFICPLNSYREAFDADFSIWMNTIEEGRFDDTNKLFESPTNFVDYVVTEMREDTDAKAIVALLQRNTSKDNPE